MRLSRKIDSKLSLATLPFQVRVATRVKYWEIIADNLSKAGWNSDSISSTDREGRQFWVVAAERKDAGRFIVHAEDKLSAFLELESTTRKNAVDTLSPFAKVALALSPLGVSLWNSLTLFPQG